MSDHKTNQAMLPPDPDGHNCALDRVAAEHLRSVAPGLAPCLSCQAGLCAEHGPTVTATTTGASAPPLGYGTLTPTPRMLLHSIGCIRGHGCVPGCTGVGPIPLHPGQAGYEEELLAKAAAHAPAPPQPEPAICRHCAAGGCAPAPAAPGEMIAPVVIRPEVLLAIFRERDDAREQREAIRKHSSAEIGRLGLEVARFRDDFAAAHGVAREADRMLGIERAARVAAEAERDRLRECHRTAAETVWEVSVARTKVEKALAAAEAEREAYRQDRDLTAHRLAAAEAENGRLQDRYKAQAKQIAAAEAEVASLRVEVSRLRLVYDDPSLDATDGAHPAWWRGSDAGVAGAVRIVNEALDGPLPLVGCVGGADLEAVRQRVAALRASVARLVETGDEARDILNAILDNQYTYRERVDAVDRWVARWAAAKAGRALDAPAGSEAKR